MSFLVKSFAGLGDAAWPAAAAIIALSAAFAVFGLVMGVLIYTSVGPAAAGVMLAIGQAALMLGAGIALAAAGFALMIVSIAKFGAVAAKNIPLVSVALVSLVVPLMYVGAGLVVFGLGLMFIAAAATLAAGPLILLGVAFVMLGFGVKLASDGIAKVAANIASMFDSLNKSNPENISKSISALFDSITLTGIATLGTFSLAVSKLNEELSSLNNNLASVVKNMSNLDGVTAKATVSMQTPTQVSNVISTTTAAAKATSDAAMSNQVSTAGTSNIVPVAIYIDSKKVGEILDPRYKQLVDDKLYIS